MRIFAVGTKNIWGGGLANIWGGAVPPGPNVEPPLGATVLMPHMAGMHLAHAHCFDRIHERRERWTKHNERAYTRQMNEPILMKIGKWSMGQGMKRSTLVSRRSKFKVTQERR